METQKPTEPTKPEAQNPAPDTPVLNPFAELVSHFEDDPYWEVMMDSIRRNRREMDAAWDNVEQCVYLMDLVRELNRAPILRYDDEAARIFRDFPASAKRAGSQDCRIAAVAQANGFIVVTSNTTHFTKIGAACEDWSLSSEA